MSNVTPYAAILAFADLGTARIERIFIKERLEEAVRYRRTGSHAVRPLELPEDELLVLLGDAIAARVFSKGFLADLYAVLDAQGHAGYA
jgi:hypothetical protein